MIDRVHVPRGAIMRVLLALAFVLSLVVAQAALADTTTQTGVGQTNGSGVTVNLPTTGTKSVGTAQFTFTLGSDPTHLTGYCIDLHHTWAGLATVPVTTTTDTTPSGDDAALAWILSQPTGGITADQVRLNQLAVWVLTGEINATSPTNDSTLNGQVANLIAAARAATAPVTPLGVTITPPAPGETTAQVTVTGPKNATVALSVTSGSATLPSTLTLDGTGHGSVTLNAAGTGPVTVSAHTTSDVGSIFTLTKIWPQETGATQGTATAARTPRVLEAEAGVTFTAKPTLTVEKVVENGDRYGDLSDIPFAAQATPSGEGSSVLFTPLFAGDTVTEELEAGTKYTVDEIDIPRGFELKDVVCRQQDPAPQSDDGEPAARNTFTPEANENWICTITNTYVPPTVTVNKVVVDAAGNVVTPEDGATFSARLEAQAPVESEDGSITGLVANGPASAAQTLDVGTTYTLAEGDMPNANYAAKGAPVCTLTNPVEQTPAAIENTNTFTPNLGDIWHCTITNVYTPPVTPPAPPVTPPAPPVAPAPEVQAQAVAPRPATAVLRITKTGPKRAKVMKAFTYTIRVRNTSKVVARNVIVRDTLPAGMIKISTSPKATQKGRVLTIKLGNLKPKATRTIRVKVRFAANVRGTRTNIAVARAANAKPVKAKAKTRVIAPAKRVIKPAVTG